MSHKPTPAKSLGPGVCEICRKSGNHLLIRPQGLRYHESCMRDFKKNLYTTPKS